MGGRSESLSPSEARELNIIEIGLHSSAMLRVFVEGSKWKLAGKMRQGVLQISRAESEEQYRSIHDGLCRWGTETIHTAPRRVNGRIIKPSGPASYGQIAKVVDIVMKVSFYYCHFRECGSSKNIQKWLNAAVDNAMIAELKKRYPEEAKEWPASLEEVDRRTYCSIQQIVRRCIDDKHDRRVIPVQFDDMLWRELNR